MTDSIMRQSHQRHDWLHPIYMSTIESIQAVREGEALGQAPFVNPESTQGHQLHLLRSAEAEHSGDFHTAAAALHQYFDYQGQGIA